MSSRKYVVLPLVFLLAACGSPTPARLDPVETPRIPLADVLAAVRKAPAIRTLPADLTPSLATTGQDLGFDSDRCEVAPAADRIDACVFGDRASATRVVLYGDSHAGMWLPPLIQIAERQHWRLEFYGKPGCPAVHLSFWNQQEDRPFGECDRFRAFVGDQVRAARPALVVVTNESFAQKVGRGVLVTAGQWRTGLAETLATLHRSADQVVLLGDTPVLAESGPDCLARHARNVPACFTSRAAATVRVWNDADAAAARSTGSEYVSVLPWLCGTVCTPVIGNISVYRNRFHLTATYARMMTGVLEDVLVGVRRKD